MFVCKFQLKVFDHQNRSTRSDFSMNNFPPKMIFTILSFKTRICNPGPADWFLFSFVIQATNGAYCTKCNCNRMINTVCIATNFTF